MLRDSKGVSPVIGVILMVALTVVMAAVVASFTAGLGKVTKTPPTANLVAEDDGATDVSPTGNYTLIKITHKGGDAIYLNETVVIITYEQNGNSAKSTNNEVVWTDSSGTFSDALTNHTTSDPVFNIGETRYLAVYANKFSMGSGVGEGTFNVMIIHKPTNQLILDADVFCD